MKLFFFPLQRLLGLREFREKEAELALGRANSARDAIRIELEGIARERFASSASRTGGLPIQDLLVIERYITRLDTKKETLLNDLAAAELVVEQMREKYIEATRDRQVISKLKEKKEAVWHKENLDAEAAVLDDISNSRQNIEPY